MDKGKLIRTLAVTLNLLQSEVSQALATKGRLALSGLVKVDNSWCRNLKSKLDLMEGVVDNLLAPQLDSEQLFAGCYGKGMKPQLNSSDFAHMQKQYDRIKGYLQQAIAQNTVGVNILIHGLPGSGKSEMVRTLADEMGAELFEIAMEDSDGDALNSNERFSAYQLSQQILKRSGNSVILFDEIEDVFPEPTLNSNKGYSQTSRKAWINRLLESNAVPACWLSNRIHHIDPAFLRRFDIVLEMPTPDRKGRQHILDRYLNGVKVSPLWLERVSEHEHLMPAHIEKAAKVVQLLAQQHGGTSEQANENALEEVLNGMMKAIGRPVIKSGQNMSEATIYNAALLNTNIDISNLLAGIKRSKRGNLCFYGAPGTGKTALAAHIAKEIEKPLLSKKTSDILSMWVGGTEQNIARMFEQAQKEDAVLVLDEADSLLRDRRSPKQSWEVTQVNELLVQMEQFDGLFICSTNLMDDLDQASLRRFAIKVEFGYLRAEQAIQMLEQESSSPPTAALARAIAMIPNLAPGDFAAVKKRLTMLGLEATPGIMLRELKAEVQFKQGGGSKAIGFIRD